MKDGAEVYVINLDEHADICTHWIVIYIFILFYVDFAMYMLKNAECFCHAI